MNSNVLTKGALRARIVAIGLDPSEVTGGKSTTHPVTVLKPESFRDARLHNEGPC